MSKGEISYSKVRAITRVATPDNEQQLLTIARGATASQVERVVRAWRKIDVQAEKDHARYQQSARSLQVYTDDDGMVVVRGRLSPEAGAVLMKALDAARESLYKEEKNVEPTKLEQERSPEQRGAGVPASPKEATSRRIACDASIVTMTHDSQGNVLDVGRKPVEELVDANGLTLEGWEGKPKWGFTPIDGEMISDYWNDARP